MSAGLIQNPIDSLTTECRSCGRISAPVIEMSRLVHRDGDLLETPVVALMHLCDECTSHLVKHDWTRLGAGKP